MQLTRVLVLVPKGRRYSLARGTFFPLSHSCIFGSFVMALPALTEKPFRHPDCCLSLSSKFVDTITSTLHGSIGSGLALSVGSGTGLLEAVLHDKWTSRGPQLQIEGVEVYQPTSAASSSNKYLLEQCYATVKGTWELSPRTQDAAALLFVYPRNPDLVRRYMQAFALPSSGIRLAIWLGPKSDWPDFEPCFPTDGDRALLHEIHGEDAGLAEYEMMVTIKKPLQTH